MSDIKHPVTPEQALARFDEEVKRIQEALQRRLVEIRADLEVNTKAAKDVVENMPLLLAKSLAFLSRDFTITDVVKGKWTVDATLGNSGYGDPTRVREQTVAEIGLARGTYRAIFILYPA